MPNADEVALYVASRKQMKDEPRPVKKDGPSWAADPAIWSKAEEAVDPEGKGADYDDPWAVTAYVYAKMGGTKKTSKA